MSPQEARRAVGQPDIVEHLRGGNGLCREAADTIDRLRAIISRVRHLTAYTAAEWAMSEIRELLEETP
jgi:hypothetical protein